jgi:hypothetical protein
LDIDIVLLLDKHRGKGRKRGTYATPVKIMLHFRFLEVDIYKGFIKVVFYVKLVFLIVLLTYLRLYWYI